MSKVSIGNVKSCIKSYSSEANLILIGIDEFFSQLLARQGFMLIPEWVMFKLDLTKPFSGRGRNKGPTFATKVVFGMKVCSHQQGLLDFLAKNPFISLDQGKLKGLIFSQQDHPLTLEEAQDLNKAYYIPGIDNLVIASLRGFTQEAEEFSFSQSPRRLHLTRLNPDTLFGGI